MTLLTRARRNPAGDQAAAATPGPLDVQAIRRHFTFPQYRRIVTNNAASTQPPRELLAPYQSLAPGYENVHRGQSSASRQMTEQFEASSDDVEPAVAAAALRQDPGGRTTTTAASHCPDPPGHVRA